jgi:hypothetical protein
MTMTTAERGSRGGRARAAKLTPEQRRDAATTAYLAGAVNTVARRTGDLTPQQRQLLRDAISEAP